MGIFLWFLIRLALLWFESHCGNREVPKKNNLTYSLAFYVLNHLGICFVILFFIYFLLLGKNIAWLSMIGYEHLKESFFYPIWSDISWKTTTMSKIGSSFSFFVVLVVRVFHESFTRLAFRKLVSLDSLSSCKIWSSDLVSKSLFSWSSSGPINVMKRFRVIE